MSMQCGRNVRHGRTFLLQAQLSNALVEPDSLEIVRGFGSIIP